MNSIKMVGFGLCITASSLYAQEQQVPLAQFVEQAQRCCTAVENKYKDALEAMKNKENYAHQRTRALLSHTGPAKATESLAPDEKAKVTSGTSTLESIISMLIAIRSIVIHANEVVTAAHTVVDNIDALVKKLCTLRISIYDYFYPPKSPDQPTTALVPYSL